jgi:hypothetical protein
MRFHIGLSLMTLLLCVQAQAQISGERAGTWEAGFHVADMSAVTLDGIFGSLLDVDGGLGYGFTGGYNFTNRLALMLDVNWATPRYRATFVPDGSGSPRMLRQELGITTIHAKGVYYFLEGDLTPFIEAGFGWTHLDSNIVNGPPITGCWWDPWWGYVCQSFYETYDETRGSYSTAVGIRWDLSSELMLRGSLGALKVNTSQETEDAVVDTLQLDFAWRF